MVRRLQTTKRLQVHDVKIYPFTVAFFGLKVHRDLAEPSVIEQVSKRFQSHFSFADVFVSVTAGPKWLFAVVQVEGFDLSYAEVFFHLTNGRFIFVGALHGVAGRERMACVNANTNALWKFQISNDVTQVFKFPTEIGALPCSIFQ